MQGLPLGLPGWRPFHTARTVPPLSAFLSLVLEMSWLRNLGSVMGPF